MTASHNRAISWHDRLARLSPGQLIAGGFLAVIIIGTLLLMMPFAVADPVGGQFPASAAGGRGPLGGAPILTALFTATSAVCVTGLIVVDTAVYWSLFGKIVLGILIALGGLGVMTVVTVMGRMIFHRFNLSARFTISTATGTNLAQTTRIVANILVISLTIEAVTALGLTWRLWSHYGYSIPHAIGEGTFTAISAFNNAGFALQSDNLMWAAHDPLILLMVAIPVILGGLGFPVIVQLLREFRRPKVWNVGTHLVLRGTAILLTVGTLGLIIMERNNPATLGKMGAGDAWLNAFFASVVTRTAGFNSIDVGGMQESSWALQDILMFIGGGPAGTAGGLKITTLGVIVAMTYAEIRGRQAVTVAGRQLPQTLQREVITVVTLAAGAITTCAFIILAMTEMPLGQVLFESVSAFSTVGLSTGITPILPGAAQLLLCVLMFIGRIGPVSLATALAMRTGRRPYQLPVERPIIG
ncbi:MAG: potassium transporter TrkG [Flaviflexus sp.]|nr:potassium transporter TrkG [Flaviflexus sp.]